MAFQVKQRLIIVAEMWEYSVRLGEYNVRLARLPRDGLGVELPDNFVAISRANAQRVGPSNFEDLGSLVLLECWELKKSGIALDVRSVVQVVDRIRHRIVRKAKRRREVPLISEPADASGGASLATPPLANSIFSFLRSKSSALDVYVFEQRYLDGRNVKDIANELGMPQSTVYDRLAKTKKALAAFLAGRGIHQRP